MSIGNRLKKTRDLYGFTQADVSQLLRISDDTLALWEEGKRLPNETSLSNLSLLYTISSQDLLQQEPDGAKGTFLQKAFGTVTRAFSEQLSKEQSPPLTAADLTSLLHKKGLIIVPTLAESAADESSALLETNLTNRYKKNVTWLRVNALEARNIVAKESIDLVVFTPVTSIFTDQIKHVAQVQPVFLVLSSELYQQLTTA